jgi:toxin ParE1/3/4
MARYALRLLRLAEEDLADALSYIAAERPQAAKALATRVEKDLILLASNPYLGRTPNDEELMRLGYRYLIIEDYLIFYTIEGQSVIVHRIIHGARDYSGLI